jgi:hypothetical protein
MRHRLARFSWQTTMPMQSTRDDKHGEMKPVDHFELAGSRHSITQQSNKQIG